MSDTTEDGPPGEREPGLQGDLTERQQKILQAIRDSLQRRGYAPSFREIGDAVELKSTAAVSYQLTELEAKGVLRREPGQPRAMEILLPAPSISPAAVDAATSVLPQDTVLVPLLGRIKAGYPVLAEENIEDIIALPSWLLPRSGNLFLLKVLGDSMNGAGILGGDLVLVRQQPRAENGEVVAALIEGEATVKTLKLTTDHIWLMPHNTAYTPIPGDNATILGKIVSVLRKVE